MVMCVLAQANPLCCWNHGQDSGSVGMKRSRILTRLWTATSSRPQNRSCARRRSWHRDACRVPDRNSIAPTKRRGGDADAHRCAHYPPGGGRQLIVHPFPTALILGQERRLRPAQARRAERFACLDTTLLGKLRELLCRCTAPPTGILTLGATPAMPTAARFERASATEDAAVLDNSSSIPPSAYVILVPRARRNLSAYLALSRCEDAIERQRMRDSGERQREPLLTGTHTRGDEKGWCRTGAIPACIGGTTARAVVRVVAVRSSENRSCRMAGAHAERATRSDKGVSGHTERLGYRFGIFAT